MLWCLNHFFPTTVESYISLDCMPLPVDQRASRPVYVPLHHPIPNTLIANNDATRPGAGPTSESGTNGVSSKQATP
jgi:hypothetical protein